MTARAHTQMVRRIIATFGACDASELAAGRAWYDRARRAAVALDPADVDRAAAVIAHLSPRQNWARNVADAAAVLQAADTGADCPRVSFPVQRAKAWAVARGEASPDAAHGPKTSDFHASIMGATDRPCIDSWAARVATGDHTVTRITDAQYRRIADAYRAAADVLGVPARDVQAACWVHIRGGAE